MMLIAGCVAQEWRRPLCSLSVAGAVSVVADYHYGWFTVSVPENLSFLAGLMGPIFVINLAAGLVAAYFLLREAPRSEAGQGGSPDVFTRRNLTTIACLTGLGVGVLGAESASRNAVRAEVVEQERQVQQLANEQAIHQAHLDQEAAKVEHVRVIGALEGYWRAPEEEFSVFDPPERTRYPYLQIVRSGSGFQAVLRNAYRRVEYRCEVIDRDPGKPNSTVLSLTPVTVQGDQGRQEDSGFYLTLLAVPREDNSLSVWAEQPFDGALRMAFSRVTTPHDRDRLSFEEMFANWPSGETEIKPIESIRLRKTPDSFTWDELRLAEIESQGVRVFETALTVRASGGVYHHLVLRWPNGDERKTWVRREQ
jgi:hypothetical protein